MNLTRKIAKVLGANALLCLWCASMLSLNSAWTPSGNPDPGAVIIIMISAAFTWTYLVDKVLC